MNDLDPSAVFARQAVLDKIASGESPGYNVLYGGSTFSDMSQHPDVSVPIAGGRGFSTAAGRYQFLKSTWDEEAKKLGLKDFSPASQDEAAWDLAASTYKAKTGKDLLADSQARSVDWSALGDTWASLKNAPAGSPAESYTISIPDESLVGKSDTPVSADAITKLMSQSYKFSPVDYDPFEVEKKIEGNG